ncbi:MAG: hypothetical protein QOF49_67, partial [Chloroflexota bacterium]|nr:hypothetical protein [Chloroflexota bacterium]
DAADDFDHPKSPAGAPIRLVLYRLGREVWAAAAVAGSRG